MSDNITIYRDTSKAPTADEALMASRVAASLDREYPGYRWQIAVRDGIAIVRNAALDPEFGYVIHLGREHAPLEKAAIRAAGEILERHGLDRHRFDGAGYAVAAGRAARGHYGDRSEA